MAPARSTDQGGQKPRAGGGTPSGITALARMLIPFALLILALVLPGHMFQADQTASRVGLGPAAWPRAMLLALALFAALWIARDFWAAGRASRRPTLTFPVEDGHYNYGKAIVGLVLIVAYGWLLPILGFATATAGFILIWCLFGGLRNPVLVIPVTLIGTIALLWLFMGLALMPLPRGSGVFDGFSIWLLRATGIY